MKYLFKRDTLFTTSFVFLFVYCLKFFSFNFHIFDPIHSALRDVEFNDFAFHNKNKNNLKSANIVIVDAENANRAEIADLLEKLKHFKPKITGVDLFFSKEAKDTTGSFILEKSICNYPNIILATKGNVENNQYSADDFYFSSLINKTGYVNLIGENQGVIRSFLPYYKIAEGKIQNSFAAAILEMYDKNAYNQLVNKQNDELIINYKLTNKNIFIISWKDVLRNTVDPTLINDKIVLVGHIDQSGFDVEDKHYTPMNDRFINKRMPDMNGAVIHANILNMMLTKSYIYVVPTWLVTILTILICYIHIAFFIKYYIHAHIWFHIRFKVIQLLSSIFFVYLSIKLLSWGIYINVSLLLTSVILSVDVLYFYEAGAKWLNKKLNFKTTFINTNH